MKVSGIGLRGVAAGVVVALAAGVVLSVLVTSSTLMSLLTQATIYAVFASGLGVLLRRNGMVSFGHAVFFGATGYVIGALLQTGAVPAELAILIAIATISAFAFLYGLIIVRVPGIAFGMITLAVDQMFYVLSARSRGLTGGADGMNINWPATIFAVPLADLYDPATMFLVSWVVLVLTVACLTLLLRGRFGAMTEATRDNEERARFIGIRTLLPRAAVFTLSAFVTSLAGALSAIYTGFVSPDSTPLGANDYSPYIAQLKAAKPDAIWVAEAGRDAIAFVKQAKQFGLIPATKMIGQVLITDYTAKATGTALDGIAGTLGYVSDLNTPENKIFVADWKQKFNELPVDYYAQAYNAMEVLFDGVGKAGSVKPLDVAKALSGATLDTIYGSVKMRAADHQLLLPNFIARMKMVGGKLRPVLEQEYPASIVPPPSPACKM